MKTKSLILTTLLLTPTLSFAFFCPTNFAQINMGDSMEQVTAACGKPDTQDGKDAEDNTPQEWTYFAPQSKASESRPIQIGIGTMKVVMSFDETSKVMNITVNGMGVNTTTVCGKDIKLGDTRDMVKSTCGDPKFVVKAETNAAGGPPQPAKKIITFIYNTSPPSKLTFEGGRLTGRE
jgi:hypothetical protein